MNRDRELDRLREWMDAKHKSAPSRPFGPREMVIEIVCAIVAAALGYIWMVGMLCL